MGHVMVTVTHRNVIVSAVVCSVTLQSPLEVIFIGGAIKREKGFGRWNQRGLFYLLFLLLREYCTVLMKGEHSC